MSLHCRACGEPIYSLNPRNLFNHENEDIRQNIEAITGIKLSYLPHLPSHICSCCYLDLNHSISFRERCLETQKHLMTDAIDGNKIISYLKSDPFDEGEAASEFKCNIDCLENTNLPTAKELSPKIEGGQKPSSLKSPRVRIMRCRDPSEALRELTRPAMVTIPPKVTIKPVARLIPTAGPRIFSVQATKIVPDPIQKGIAPDVRYISDNVKKVKQKKPRIAPLEKKYVCEHCGWSFRDLSNMKDHALRHSGVKNFECEECGLKFFTRPLLMLHIRVHHKGEKPFVCKYCGIAFRNSPSRCRHERTYHPNELPFVCNLCSRTFISKISLDKHKEVHVIGEKIYRCETCKKVFKGAACLKKHRKTIFHQRRLLKNDFDEDNYQSDNYDLEEADNQLDKYDLEEAEVTVSDDEMDFNFSDSIIEEIDN